MREREREREREMICMIESERGRHYKVTTTDSP